MKRVLGMLLTAAALGALEPDGLVCAGRTAAAPVLDGALDDVCWQQTIELTPFVLMNQRDLASEQTRAYVAWDDAALYLAFRCEESCLDPVNNQLAAFRAKVTEKDNDAIYSDDCVMVLLDPGGDCKTILDLCVNAAGTVADAKASGDDPWSCRDRTWEYGGELAARTYPGFWVVELAIPFASLGGPPKPGAAWRLCLGRVQQNRKEKSTWQPLANGFHRPTEFAALRFVERVCGVRSLSLGDFSAGANQTTLEVLNHVPGRGLRVETSVIFEGQGRDVAFRDVSATQTGRIEHDYALDRGGAFRFQLRLLDPASMDVQYRSPLYGAEVSVSLLTGRLLTAADGVLYLNGKEVARTANGEREFRVALQAGTNVLALESGGTAEASFAVGEFTFTTDGRWKSSAKAPEDWTSQAFDDSGWGMAKAEKTSLGTAGQRTYFRKTVLHGHTEFWPNWADQALTIAEDSVQQLLLVPQGLKGRTLTDYQVWVDLPVEFRLLGATGFYGRSHQRGGFLGGGREAIVRDGQEYRRYMVRALEPVRYQQDIPDWRMCALVIALPASGQGKAEREAVFHYGLEAEKGAIQEVGRALRVRILPPLRGKQPKKLAWQIGAGNLSTMDDVPCAEALAATLTRAGFNTLWNGRAYPSFSARNLAMFSFNGWAIDCRPYLAEHPDAALIGRDGKPRLNPADARSNHISPSLLVRDTSAWQFVEDAIVAWVRKEKLREVCWDFESSVWDDKAGSNQIAGFGPPDLADFRESAGIPAGTALDYTTIKEKYPQEWTHFMNQRLAQLSGKIRQAVKKADPGATFSVYSGYQCDETKRVYGVDWALLAGRIDLAICGYGRPVDQVQATLAALGTTPLALGDLVVPYETTSKAYPSWISKATILRRVVDGTGGFLAWHFPNLDGRSFFGSAEASRLVADYEDLFVARQRDSSLATVQGIPTDDVVVLTDGRRRLVLLINETSQSRPVKVSHRQLAPGTHVRDYYAGLDLGSAAECATTVGANDVKAFLVEPP